MNPFGRFIGRLVALLFILTGAVLLLGNLGFIVADPFKLAADLWPVLLIIIGLYFIWLRLRPAGKPKSVVLAESLGDASRADINVNFGAGALIINPLKKSDNLFEGDFLMKPEKLVRRSGSFAEVKLRYLQWPFLSFFSWSEDDWKVGLSTKIPLSLRLNTGASRVVANLTDNKIETLDLNTGASDVVLKLPKASGYTRVLVKGGATDIKFDVPKGVAARIKSTGTLSSLKVDEKRFPMNGSLFVSPDFDSAQNKVDIIVSAGASSITVS
ncbi:MAG: DUF5668 domain-containing protein [Firmicutes bacterium]|nr:DUF5668 domain-containing protein [Bacillota bacterium]